MANSKMLFSSPLTAATVQQAALAFREADILRAYYTTFGFVENGATLALAALLDRVFDGHLALQLRRRAIFAALGDVVHFSPGWEILRTVLNRAGLNDDLVESIRTHSLHNFDRHVASRIANFDCVYAYHNSALATFEAAKKRGVRCIYGVQNFDPETMQSTDDAEVAKFPALAAARERFSPERQRSFYARRKAEWALADIVIVNSDACRASYENTGVDMGKVRVVPLAFPEGTPEDGAHSRSLREPLNVLWSGTFSIRKGAHYFLQALDLLSGAAELRVKVFGAQHLPKEMLTSVESFASFRAAIPRSELFEQYRAADILVLPTLADSFAMVVTEAMSQGLPVLTTDNAGASTFIKNGENGFVVPAFDAKAIADVLLWCARNRSALQAMGQQAKKSAASRSWRDFRQDLVKAVTGF